MSFHYLKEDGSGAYLLEDGSGYYLFEPLVYTSLWYFDNAAMSFDNPGYLFDGTVPIPLGPAAIISIEMELSELVRGTINLAWLPTPYGSPATYAVYVNGQPQLTTQAQSAVVTGLLVDTSYLFYIVGPVNAFPLVPVQSNAISYRFGSTEIQYTTVPLVGITPGD
jgi:hypothetical protein